MRGERARCCCTRAFELGRIRLAARTFAVTGALGIAAWISQPGLQTLIWWVPVALLAFLLAYVGMGWQQANRPGLTSGVVLAVVPTILGHGRPCADACSSCSTAWFLASALAAGVLVYSAHGWPERKQWAGGIGLAILGPLPLLGR